MGCVIFLVLNTWMIKASRDDNAKNILHTNQIRTGLPVCARQLFESSNGD